MLPTIANVAYYLCNNDNNEEHKKNNNKHTSNKPTDTKILEQGLMSVDCDSKSTLLLTIPRSILCKSPTMETKLIHLCPLGKLLNIKLNSMD